MNTRILSIPLLLLALASCSINPATGTPDLVLMSEEAEIAMGKEMHEKLLKSVPVYQDEELAAYVDRIGQKVAKNSHRPDIKYHFTVIDAPDINAFALPGGYIYINRGLLAYLDSEAQLAAVLAHEVGHVTARHVVRQDTARKGAGILSIFSVFTTGSTVIGDVTNLWSTAAVKGYGREMELEADGFGAEYLFNSGYDPLAMVETIGVLKDQEKFSRYRAKEEGKKTRSYHGVFSTHPRNDIRLKEVIAKAGEFPANQSSTANKSEYRKHTEGLVYGVNYDAKLQAEPKEPGRYTHAKLGFSLVFPEKWQIENTRKAIVSQPDDKSAEIKLTVALTNKSIPPADYLRGMTKTQMLQRSEDFAQNGLIGHTGIIVDEQGDYKQRVAVLYQGRRAYMLTGTVINPQADVDYDEMFLKSIHSFKPQKSSARKQKSKTLHYVKANENTNIEQLAKQLKIGAYAPQQLRLINGLYPRGEPEPGNWIKIIQ
ncbi:M48 family metalloprotease [Thalassomonas viridans]|uniref:M48 family metalloprotease n=1 Tax=Thalassomonas viridans TaxID=137584 RepID=A0AAF0C8B0_9GAMM|nr:M48 family metalloprotease [Thalassomonas viridans]WDE04020.1 M48 family metalloprotease [Thalassomonas viridans]